MTINGLKERFLKIYGGSRDGLRVFASPGRVNLIGEHTDYNGGLVFPAALSVDTKIIARPRNDRLVNLAATDLEVRVSASLDGLEKYKKLEWGNYQLGVADELQKAGYMPVGCDMLYHDTVPHGAGLSSSASIEVATALAMLTFANEAIKSDKEIDKIELAVISQRAENRFVGMNCGIMDQFASAMGRANHAIMLDCRDLSYELVPLDLAGCKIVLSNTNKKRSLTSSKYNERRSECEKGLEILRNALPGIGCLCDVSPGEYNEYKHLLKDENIRKRVEHVIFENQRVKESVAALKNGDIDRFGKLMEGSHNSLKHLYEVTGAELDILVEEALKINGVLGSRMTGAGFGGCTVSIVRDEAVESFIGAVGKRYHELTGLEASFYVSEIGDGARELKDGT